MPRLLGIRGEKPAGGCGSLSRRRNVLRGRENCGNSRLNECRRGRPSIPPRSLKHLNPLPLFREKLAHPGMQSEGEHDDSDPDEIAEHDSPNRPAARAIDCGLRARLRALLRVTRSTGTRVRVLVRHRVGPCHRLSLRAVRRRRGRSTRLRARRERGRDRPSPRRLRPARDTGPGLERTSCR